MKLVKTIILSLGLILLSAQLALAAPLAGHVILTKGQVTATAEDGTNRALKRRSEIFNGDVIRTGPTGSVQIRFIDKALMTIKANSEMNMEAYLLAQEGNTEQKEQVLMSLVKGGFRTITGTIGKGDKSAYKVNTPAASIGIRGTNYEVQQEADGGFVMGVYSGGIQVENEAGSIELGEGADFNFTRVKPKSAPKGLLAPPPTLGENSATEQSEEEENSEEGADENSDESNDEGQSGDDENDANNNDNDGGDDGEGTEIITGSTDNAGNVEGDVNTAIDRKLAETIEETKDEFVDAGGADQVIIDALVEAGILQLGQTFADLHPDLQALVEAWLANPTSVNDLIAAIQESYNQIVNATFDFSDPYADITPDTSNPFADTVITDQQYALAESGKLAFMAIPVNSTTNYVGESPNIQTFEAQLVSPLQISSLFVAEDYTSNPTSINLSFKLLDVNTGVSNRYDVNILFDGSIPDTATMASHINTVLSESSYTIDGQAASGAITSVTFSYNATDDRFEFKPTTDSTHFITEMEIQFSEDPTQATGTTLLMAQLGADTTTTDNFWYADAGLDMVIGNGSLDANGKPILVLKDQHTYTDQNSNTITENTIEVVKKIPADTTTSSLLSFASCVTNNATCDIQVDSVTAGSNIRWGAWLTEPGKGIQINEFFVNDSTSSVDTEDQILAFWLAAERADINQLTGTANFSTDSNCLSFGQCVGFSDDGIVQSLTASFAVDFDRASITNGNLTLQTSANPTIGVLGNTPGDVASTWSVNFSGQLISENGSTKPEFQTQSLTGTVTDGTGTHGSIIGNIGGIFVKPGDTFAGGYNLGTADGSNKHAAGVFTMDKQ